MPRTCSICSHPERQAIDRALLADSRSFRDVARQYGVSKDALLRHKNDHLAGKLAGVAARNAEADVRIAIDAIGQLREINAVARTILHGALARGNGPLALQAIDRVHRQIELQARLIDLLSDGGTINVIVSPQWISLRTAILVALEPHPAARLAVAAALQGTDGGDRS